MTNTRFTLLSSTLGRAALVFAVVGAAACTGSVEGPEGPGVTPGNTGGGSTTAPMNPPTGTPGGTGGQGPGPTAGAGAPTMNPPVTMPPANGEAVPETAGEFVLRRLSNREYDQTLADLLKDTTRPAQDFPDDPETETGYVAPTNVASLNAQYFSETADALADAAVMEGRVAVPCTPTAADETTCARQFITTFGKRAYRRPLLPAEVASLEALFKTARELQFEFKPALAQLVKAMLQSPNFIYHWELGPTKGTPQNGVVALTQYQLASRLSYLLWETMPDDVLLAAADANQLSTPEQLEAQALRLLASPRAKSALDSFHTQWLQLQSLADITKSTAKYPAFTEEARPAVISETGEFAQAILTGSGEGTLKALLTAPYTFANQASAPLYGANASGTQLVKTDLNPAQRAGILTQTGFLAARADAIGSNPALRGITVFKKLLCGQLPAQPAVIPEVAAESANVSTRERFALHAQPACAGCHVQFDAYGFAFENYDGVGQFRSMDGGKPVDASGNVTTPGGAQLKFSNAVEMAQQLAASDEVQWCMTRQWFRYMLGRPDAATEKGSMQLAYNKAKATPGFSLRDLILTKVKSMAFRSRLVQDGETF